MFFELQVGHDDRRILTKLLIRDAQRGIRVILQVALFFLAQIVTTSVELTLTLLIKFDYLVSHVLDAEVGAYDGHRAVARAAAGATLVPWVGSLRTEVTWITRRWRPVVISVFITVIIVVLLRLSKILRGSIRVFAGSLSSFSHFLREASAGFFHLFFRFTLGIGLSERLRGGGSLARANHGQRQQKGFFIHSLHKLSVS